MPEPPGSMADEASPAGTALAPIDRRHRPTSFTTSEIRNCYVTKVGTIVNGKETGVPHGRSAICADASQAKRRLNRATP